MKKSMILLIIDGLGDEFIPELNGTPLEFISNKLSIMNKFAKEGMCGVIYPVRPGIPPSSDTAHLTLFGYDISKEYTGRGYFEALGANIPLEMGDVALRFNFATVEKKGDLLIISDRRAGRISGEDAKKLAADLQKAIDEKGLPVKIYSTVEHRGVMVIKDGKEKLSRMVNDTDPHEINMPILAAQPLEETPPDELENAKRTADIINQVIKLSYYVLDTHPINIERKEKGLPKANVIIARGAGKAVNLKSMNEKWGVTPAYVAAGPLYKGVAKAVGMTEINVPGATGTVKTDLNGKVNGVLRALDNGYDFVFMHVKAVDNLSHDKKPREKAEFIRKIDEAIKPFSELDDIVIVITGDHSTSSLAGRHIGLSVPILFWSRNRIRKSMVNTFNEKECMYHGSLGVLNGIDVLPMMLDMADRFMEFGMRPSHKQVLYIGAFGEPLKV